MDPRGVFCANPACPDRGATDKGNIKIHSRKERRFRCATCKKTFAATTGTPFYRLHEDRSLLVCVVTLLAHGCPLPAVVAAFGLDERTVAEWRDKAGSHCQAAHQRHLETKPLDLGHVQADELYAKRQGGRSWVAMAMAVPSRLWLGGVVSPIRVVRRVVWGTLAQVLGQLAKTKTGEKINTSYIERRNATFRACLAGLTRRGRRQVRDEGRGSGLGTL